MPARPIRVQRLLAACGAAPSRRHAELLISAGRVTVVPPGPPPGGVSSSPPSVTCSLGATLSTDDFGRLRLDGKPLPSLSATSSILCGVQTLYAFHKPRGYLSAWTDARYPPRGTLTDALKLRGPAPPSPRLLHAGRLDLDSEGLLLLTPDGDLALRITHPSQGCMKRYVVVAVPSRTGAVTPAHRLPAALIVGVILPAIDGDDGVGVEESVWSASLAHPASSHPASSRPASSRPASATSATIVSWDDVFSIFRDCGAEAHVVDDVPLWSNLRRRGAVAVNVGLVDGRKRVVRRMFQTLGWRVERLLRVSVGSVHLGTLLPGQWMDVDAKSFELK